MCKAEMKIIKTTTLTEAGKKAIKAEKKAVGPTKYKKAPGAPRRFKSAFIFFSTQKHKEIRLGLGKAGEKEKTTNVAKMVSEAWKSLPSDERDYWEEMARKDKERYEMEKATYKGPWKVPAEKPVKDPNAPKRPMSAFLSYSNSKRSEVKKMNPQMTNAEVSRILAKMWKKATDDEKHDFVQRENLARKNYKEAMVEWKAGAEQRKENERQREIDLLQGHQHEHQEEPHPPQQQLSSLVDLLDMAQDELNDAGASFETWENGLPIPGAGPLGSSMGDFSLSDSFTFQEPQSFFDDLPEQSAWQQQPQQQGPPQQPQQQMSYNYDGGMNYPPPQYPQGGYHNYRPDYRYHGPPQNVYDDFHQYRHVFDPAF
mmetsp:Transcript_18278/g.26241  ORF Transcript_18278/g.26241 Transcript_18278/m.26241 type:complete len:370 (-) Transcript_18278:73-1182(-)